MENMRGALLMTLSMLGFACGDMFIKRMTADLPNGQIILMMGVLGAIVFAGMVRLRRQPPLVREMLTPVILMRNACEMAGTILFVTALSMTSFSLASTILQTTPLVVTLGAAVVLKEPVGWRRWSAICAGFGGVLLVVRPTAAGIDTGALCALLAVVALAVRDLSTRRVPRSVSSMQLSFLGFVALIPAGALLLLFDSQPLLTPQPVHWAMIAATVALIGIAYLAIVTAMRIGEVSFVTPFRYTRIVFSLTLGVLVFGDRLDAAMLAGCTVIVGSGLYTVWRERRFRAAA